MILSYTPKFFIAKELVSKAVYENIAKDFGKYTDTKIFSLFRPELLYTIDLQREYYGKAITINNWHNGGDRQYSGFRASYDSIKCATWSMHKYFCAVDYLVSGLHAQVVRKDIKDNPNSERNKYITAIEDFPDMGWTHIDFRGHNKEKLGLLIFDK